MAVIGEPIRIGDIENCEAFVQRAIDKSKIRYGSSEREELLSEGLTILLELKDRYKPGIGGRDASMSTFSGYAAMFLPRRLGDFWHRSHPSHRYVTDPGSGIRGWIYGKPALSLDGLGSTGGGVPDPERHLLHAKTMGAFCHATRVASICLPG